MKIHMVKQGDTLYLIAKKYNVPLEEIIKGNPEISNPDEIAVGMKVKIPSQPKSAVEVMHQHIVQQGDSLWKLSKAWGIQLADMIKANPQLKNPNALLTGEVVNIPKTPHGASQMNAMQSNSLLGKTNTGLKAGTGMKQDTAVKPDTSILPVQPVKPVLPMQPIQTQPLPTPPPVTITPVMPPVQKQAPLIPLAQSNPIYGVEHHENMNLFMQFPVPAVQATAPIDQPYCPDPLPYGYGMQQPLVSPSENGPGYGYGHLQGNSPLSSNLAGTIGEMYDHNDYSGYGTFNPQQFPQQQPYQQVFNQPAFNPAAVQGVASPMTMGSGKPGGCKCGGASTWPAHLDANAGAIPYTNAYPGMVSPAGNIAYGASPASVSPMNISPYGMYSQSVNPAGDYPGMQYGSNPNPQVAGASFGDMNAHAQPYGYPSQVDPYYGGIPPIPTMPPIPPMPPMGPLVDHYDDRSFSDSSSEGEVKVTASAVKKRVTKPKPKKSSVKMSRPKQKENLPWIKW